MYSDAVLKHLTNPQFVGEIERPSARGESFNPVCGDRMTLMLQVSDGLIDEARFLVDGCPPSIAAGSVLTGLLVGRQVGEATLLTPQQVSAELGGLPRNKEHCAILAIDALRAALATLPAVSRTESTRFGEDQNP